jgi:hypothetical protein
MGRAVKPDYSVFFPGKWLWPTEAVLDDSYKLPPVRKLP